MPQGQFVISLFGIDGAGKTSFLRALSGEFDFETVVTTVGFNQKTFPGDSYDLTVWDLGGHPKFRSVWRQYFADLWGFVYVIDASDSARFQESAEVLGSVRGHPMMAGKPFVVVANKVDSGEAVTVAALRATLGLSDDVPVFETSCTTVTNGQCHEGVTDAVAAIVHAIKQRHAELSEQITRDQEEQARARQKRANDRKEAAG
jgi:small GTP-binding protein